MITQKYRAGDIRHCYADSPRRASCSATSRRSRTRKASASWRNGLREQQAEDKAETMLQELSAYGLTA